MRSSTPDWIRTSNLRFRRPMLYPVELRVRRLALCGIHSRLPIVTRCESGGNQSWILGFGFRIAARGSELIDCIARAVCA